MLFQVYYSMRPGAQSRLLQLVPQMSSWYEYFHNVFLDIYRLSCQAKIWESTLESEEHNEYVSRIPL
jgi:hypothetical protein